MDMRTNWIWTPDWQAEDDRRARIVYFRKKINLSKEEAEKAVADGSVRVRISADSRYKLYVNGSFVQDGPQKALDLKEWYVDQADLSDRLTEGENVIAVEVLRYPEPNLSFGVPVSNDSLLRSPIPNLYVENLVEQGEEALADLEGKSGWKCVVNREIEVVDEDSMPAPIHTQEHVLATDALIGWRRAGYDDSAWMDAVCKNAMEMPTSDAPGNLVDRTVPYMRHTEKNFIEIKEVRDAAPDQEAEIRGQWEKLITGSGTAVIPANSTQIVEISADVEECGFLHYSLQGGAGARITTICAECYAFPPEGGFQENADEPQFTTKGDRTDSVRGRLFGHTSTYTAAGCGSEEAPEEYEPFWFRTFRYIQLKIETKDQPLVISRFNYTETGYPLEVKTSAEASDPTFAPIWDISLRTLQRCMHDTYMDCPFYEQLQYAMDGREEILYTYSVAGDDRLARQAIEAFRRSQRDDGLTNSDAPTQKSNVIPGFAIHYLMMVYDHMLYFGDKALVKRNWNAIDSILAFFERNLAENGMVGKVGGPLIGSRYWSFIDWTEQWNPTFGVPSATRKGSGAITMESLLYAYGLQKAAELSDYVGRCGIAEEYRRRADDLLEAIRTHAIGSYRDAEGKTWKLVQDGPGVDDYSVHPQVFAILTGLVSPEEGREMLEATVGNPELAQSSVSYMFYLFRALETVDWYEKTDELWELWRKMVRDHMSTCVENGTDGRSDCHAWASLMLYELPATVLGVRPAAPGYSKVSIRPVAGKLTEAKGSVVTPRGMVHVEWKKAEDGSLDVKYELPQGLELA